MQGRAHTFGGGGGARTRSPPCASHKASAASAARSSPSQPISLRMEAAVHARLSSHVRMTVIHSDTSRFDYLGTLVY
eukprot:6179442-Pleurochrysis_carterae.AAC.1